MPLEGSRFDHAPSWAYRVFLSGEVGLVLGLFLFPILYPFSSGTSLWVWLYAVLPWSPGFGSFSIEIPVWIEVWGGFAVGLLLSGLAASGVVGAFELFRTDRQRAAARGFASGSAPALSEGSYHTLRALRRWLLVDGAFSYAVGVWLITAQTYTQYYVQSAAGRYDPWPAMSTFLFAGIFLFSLSAIPAYLFTVDRLRGSAIPSRRKGRSVWTEFNTP